MAAKFQNRAIVVLYQGQALTQDVKAALLQVMAPFVHDLTKCDMFQLDSTDLAVAATGKALKSVTINFTPKVTTPETEAAKLLGITFEKTLKTGNSVLLTLQLITTLQNCIDNPSDTSTAILRALKLAAKPSFFISADSNELQKYNLTAQAVEVIRNVLKAKGIDYE